MNYPPRTTSIAVTCIAAGLLWTASQWWQTGLATPSGAVHISPNGCYRVQKFKPFWILPNIFHTRTHPGEPNTPQWLPWWSSPGFYRLYDNRNGRLIGESDIHDLTSASGTLYWGDIKLPEVSAGLITIGPNLADCIGDHPDTPQVQQ